MANENVVGSDSDGTRGGSEQIDLATLIALCQEIDPSWTKETYERYRENFYLTDSGFVKLSLGDDWVHIELLAVKRELRGKGRGRELVELAEDTARALGLIGVSVSTIVPSFFEHLGFETLGTLPGLLNGKDITVMLKEILDVPHSQEVVA